MTSVRNWEKKKNPIPPPIIATHAAICLVLDICVGFYRLTIESIVTSQGRTVRRYSLKTAGRRKPIRSVAGLMNQWVLFPHTMEASDNVRPKCHCC